MIRDRKFAPWMVAILGLALVPAGCGKKTRCKPGVTAECKCDDGQPGTKVCTSDRKYGRCQCEPPPPECPAAAAKMARLLPAAEAEPLAKLCKQQSWPAALRRCIGLATDPPSLVACDPGPLFASIDPAEGSAAGGDEVVLVGQGFSWALAKARSARSNVYFGRTQVEVLGLNDRGVRIVTPPGEPGTTVDVAIVLDDMRTAELRAGFRYRPASQATSPNDAGPASPPTSPAGP